MAKLRQHDKIAILWLVRDGTLMVTLVRRLVVAVVVVIVCELYTTKKLLCVYSSNFVHRYLSTLEHHRKFSYSFSIPLGQF